VVTFLSVCLFISHFHHREVRIDYRQPEKKARAYYVSPSGRDSNPGTANAPFQSIEKINKLSFIPGDSILFEGGRHFSGNLKPSVTASGNQRQPVLITSFGKGYAMILAGNGSGIDIENLNWVQVRKLILVGAGRKDGNVQTGLLINSSHFIKADSLEIKGFQKSGVNIDLSEDISIKHIFSHENGYAGISVGGSGISKSSNRHIYIGYCRAENNPGDPTNLNNHSGNGIVVSACTNVLIEYCTATDNGWDMPRKGNGPVGIWAFEADSVVIQHCLSYRNKTSAGGADGGGFDLDGGVTHSIVQYCLSYENQGAGYCLFQYLYASPWHDNLFRYNISENDGAVSDAHGGVYIWNSSKNPEEFYNGRFYNNTIYNAKGTAVRYSELNDRKGFSFYNNIFVARDTLEIKLAAKDHFSANDWWSTDRIQNMKTKIGIESTSYEPAASWETVRRKLINLNPEFRKAGKSELTSAQGLKKFSNYRIPGNSSLRKSGIQLKNLYKSEEGILDFNGNKPPLAGIGASF
jgi:hypothetical protein